MEEGEGRRGFLRANAMRDIEGGSCGGMLRGFMI